jgi:hypothetical protein
MTGPTTTPTGVDRVAYLASDDAAFVTGAELGPAAPRRRLHPRPRRLLGEAPLVMRFPFLK